MAQAQAAAQAVTICAIISGMQLDSVARATAAATLIQFALPALCLQLKFLWLPLPPLPPRYYCYCNYCRYTCCFCRLAC